MNIHHLVFGEKQMYTSEIVPEVWRQHDLFFLLDPAFLVCHVPVELPKFSRLPESGPTVGGELKQLFVRCLQMLHAIADDLRIARLVTWR